MNSECSSLNIMPTFFTDLKSGTTSLWHFSFLGTIFKGSKTEVLSRLYIEQPKEYIFWGRREERILLEVVGEVTSSQAWEGWKRCKADKEDIRLKYIFFFLLNIQKLYQSKCLLTKPVAKLTRFPCNLKNFKDTIKRNFYHYVYDFKW